MRNKYQNTIILGDTLDTLKEMPDDFVNLIFTSPPYNVNLDYSNCQDNSDYHVYLHWLKDIFKECKRVLVKGGRLAINIDAITNRQENDKDKEYVRCIYAHLYNIMKDIGMNFRTEICWAKQNAVGKKSAWGSYCRPSCPVIRRNHEYILVWSKDSWKMDGDSSLADITKDEFHKFTLSVWEIMPETRKLIDHPAPFPEELAYRVIKLFTFREDLVLDIFNGTGTTTSVAAKCGRRWCGIDNSEQYVDFARNRTQKSYDERIAIEQIQPFIPIKNKGKNKKGKPTEEGIIEF